VAYRFLDRMSISRRSPDGTWTQVPHLPEARVIRNQQLGFDAEGGLYLA
jgi:hypothetical protein